MQNPFKTGKSVMSKLSTSTEQVNVTSTTSNTKNSATTKALDLDDFLFSKHIEPTLGPNLNSADLDNTRVNTVKSNTIGSNSHTNETQIINSNQSFQGNYYAKQSHLTDSHIQQFKEQINNINTNTLDDLDSNQQINSIEINSIEINSINSKDTTSSKSSVNTKKLLKEAKLRKRDLQSQRQSTLNGTASSDLVTNEHLNQSYYDKNQGKHQQLSSQQKQALDERNSIRDQIIKDEYGDIELDNTTSFARILYRDLSSK